MSVCRMCLQPVSTRTVDVNPTLNAFYDELLYYNVIQHELLTVCVCCEHLLRKAYNIRQKCRRAHILLNMCLKDEFNTAALTNLRKYLPGNTIAMVNRLALQKVLAFVDTRTGPDTLNTEVKNTEIKNSINSNIRNNSNIQSDIKSYWEEFLKNDKENNINNNNSKVVQSVNEEVTNEFENTDRNKTSDIESDDNYFNDDMDIEDYFGDDDYNNETEAGDDKTLRRLQLNVRKRAKIRDWLLREIEKGTFEDPNMDSELMIKYFDRIPMPTLLRKKMLGHHSYDVDRWKGMFRYLFQQYDPKFDATFDIEFLDTYDKKVADFVSRQHSEKFIKADYKCFICFKILARRGLHDYHLKVAHDESLPLKCDICLLGFKQTKSYKRHLHTSHEVVYRCKLCSFVTYDTRLMKEHYDDHVTNRQHQCTVCGKELRTLKTLKRHMLYHMPGACCPFCAQGFTDCGVAFHMKLKHKSDPLFDAIPSIACSQCDAVFHYQDALNIHVRRDHKEYRCSCGLVFSDDMSLSMHARDAGHRRHRPGLRPTGRVRVRRRAPPSEHPAHVLAAPCDKDVSDSKNAAAGGKGAVLCDHCGQEFKVGPEYEEHVRAECGAKPYQCSECGARFAERGQAETHLKIHLVDMDETAAPPPPPKYKCGVCSKEFSHKYYLNMHEKIHEDFNRVIVTSRVVMPRFKVRAAGTKPSTKPSTRPSTRPGTGVKEASSQGDSFTTIDDESVEDKISRLDYEGAEVEALEEDIDGAEDGIDEAEDRIDEAEDEIDGDTVELEEYAEYQIDGDVDDQIGYTEDYLDDEEIDEAMEDEIVEDQIDAEDQIKESKRNDGFRERYCLKGKSSKDQVGMEGVEEDGGNQKLSTVGRDMQVIFDFDDVENEVVLK